MRCVCVYQLYCVCVLFNTVCCIATGKDDLQKILDELNGIVQVMSLGLSLGLRMSSIEKIKNDYRYLDEQKAIAIFY